MFGFSDKELVLELQHGSLEALGALYDRHSKMVYRTAMAVTGDPDAAADLLQDVFLRLHRFSDRVDPQRPLEPWLCRVTANLSYTWVRRRRWVRPLEDIAEWFVSEKTNTPHYIAEVDDEIQRVHKAIQALPLHQRVVVALYYLNDFSLQEISEILDIPVGTVKSRLHFARRVLKKQLGLQEGALTEVQYEFT